MNVFLLPHYSFTCLTSLSCKKMQRAEKDAFFMMHQLGMIINKIVKRMFWASSKSTKHFWKILARSRLNPIAICGNLKQAFSHIHIQEICRDSSKFHWIKDRNPQQTVIYIFTRLAFGLTLFALAATCQHLCWSSETNNRWPVRGWSKYWRKRQHIQHKITERNSDTNFQRSKIRFT